MEVEKVTNVVLKGLRKKYLGGYLRRVILLKSKGRISVIWVSVSVEDHYGEPVSAGTVFYQVCYKFANEKEETKR